MDTAKKRWLSLYVENDVGVLAKRKTRPCRA